MTALAIDIVSDTVCPWCYIGKRRLEAALGERTEIAVAVRWHPYQLAPELPAEGMARDAYLEAGPGENFLSTSHTLRHYAHAGFEPRIPDAGPFEAWAGNGAPTADRRAAAVWRQMLDDYREPEMAPGIRAALEAFVAERKAAMADEWH